MTKKLVKIWIWLYNDKIYKAVCCEEDGTLSIYDDQDTLLMKRTGLTPGQIRLFETTLITAGAKRVDGHQEPFTYL